MKKLLDIKPEERQKVFNLFFQNFFDGLGTAFFYAMGIFIFLGNSSHHDALHYYPLVFVIGGFLILAISPIYVRVESRARTDYLIYGLGAFVILIIILSFFLVKGSVNVYTGIVLLILYQLVYYLRQTQFWGLTALSFNVLQSKRLFSIVSAGDLPAKFLGYSIVFQLLERGIIQPENLIYFAVLAYLISFYFLRRVFVSDHHLKHSSHQHFKSGIKEVKFFGNNLIKSMAIMAFFIMFVVFVVDYTFTKVVMHKINDEDADMYLLVSTILYSSYGFASILKLFFTGKVFQNLGLKWTMVLTPVLMLLLIFSTFILNISAEDPNWYYVRMFVFLYIGFIVFRDVIGKPIFLTLFQPLSKKMRLHGHNIVKGIAEPLGMLISGGLLLIYYGYFEEYRLGLFAIALVIPIVIWLSGAVNVRRNYNRMLENVINLRLLSGNQFILIDNKTKESLIERLKSEDDIEVLFSLDHLKNYEGAKDDILPVLTHRSELVQKGAWEVLSTITKSNEYSELVQKHYNKNSTSDIKRHVFYSLALKASSSEEIEEFIADDDPEITESILMGWTKNKKFNLPEKIKIVLNNYLESSDREKYYTGLRLQKILPLEKGRAYITKSLESLNFEQRKSAIIGSFGFLNQQFFNRIVNLINDPVMSRVVKNELILHGTEALPFYIPLLDDADDIKTYRLIQVMGQIGGETVVVELVKLLRFENPDLRKLILDTIRSLEAQHLKPFRTEFINEYHKEIEKGKIILTVYDGKNEFLLNELNDLIIRIFRILNFLYNPKIIRRIEEGIFSHNSDHKANSMETLSQLIDVKLYKLFKPLLETVIEPSKSVGIGKNSSKLLYEHTILNKWSVACLVSQCDLNDEKIIKSLKGRNSTIVNEQIKIKNMEAGKSLRLMERVIMLKKTSLFAETPENILVEVAGMIEEENFDRGITLFEKGDIGDCMYIIYSGRVRIHDGISTFAVFEQNDFFGDLAMLDTQERSASATTETETTLFRLDQSAIYELMDDRVEVAQGIIQVLCHRIRNLNEKYVKIEKHAKANQLG